MDSGHWDFAIALRILQPFGPEAFPVTSCVMNSLILTITAKRRPYLREPGKGFSGVGPTNARETTGTQSANDGMKRQSVPLIVLSCKVLLYAGAHLVTLSMGAEYTGGQSQKLKAAQI